MSDIPSTGGSPVTASTLSRDTVSRLGDEANRAAREFESREQSPGGSFKGSESIRRETARLAGDLRDRARGFAETRKSAGADRLSGLAGAVERTASDLEGDAPQIARFVRDAAGRVNAFSSKLRERSVDELAADARDFARRQPLAVFGGALVAGLALARFLKAGDRGDGNR